MKQIEKFLNSIYFIIFIYLIVFISWFMGSGFFDVTEFSNWNLYGVYWLIILLSLIFVLFENSLYAIPILSGFLFIISNSSITFDTLNTFGAPHIVIILVILSFIIHLIRFKIKLKLGGLFIGLFLISLAYIIPLIYTEVTLKAVFVSSAGIIYLLFYLFLFSSTKGNIDYLFKLFIVINLLLVMQFATKVYRATLDFPDLDFIEILQWGLNNNWGPNFGWANINDVAFYITLTFPSYIYFIFKNKKNIFNWLLLLLPIMSIGISGSRGGMIGFLIVGLLIFFILVYHGKKSHYFGILFGMIIVLTLSIINIEIIMKVYDVFMESIQRGSIDSFSSNRIFIYFNGLKIFSLHPLFGSGWMSIQLVADAFGWIDWRIFMFHSTIIQVLATMGLFGLIALLIHYFQVFSILFNNFTLEKKLIIIGYIATQVHGLIDNVQFSVPYSFLIVYIFVILETSDKDTIFIKKGRQYSPISELQINKTAS